jgi:hypothetical protein
MESTGFEFWGLVIPVGLLGSVLAFIICSALWDAVEWIEGFWNRKAEARKQRKSGCN